MPAATGQRTLIKADGITSEIVQAVLSTFRQSHSQAFPLSQLLKGVNAQDTARRVFDLIKHNIRYVLDTAGQQDIPTPSRVVGQGFSDCKGYAILAVSLLKGAGVDGGFRFVSYKKSDTRPTHVYAFAKLSNGQTLTIDPCMPGFNQEQTYQHKQDYPMSAIYAISGPDDELERIASPNLDPEMHGPMADLQLMREAAALEGAIASTISGPDAIALQRASEEAVADYDAAIRALAEGNLDRLEYLGEGIIQRDAAAAVGRRRRNTKTRRARRGKLIKNVARATKRAGRGALRFAKRAVTAPVRLAATAALRLLGRQVAPAFLYIFITNPKTVEALPEKVKRKRNRQLAIMRVFTQKLGVSEGRFRTIVANGIKRKMRQTPQQVLSRVVTGPISGIGVAPAALAFLPQLLELIQKILGGGKAPMGKDDGADPEGDFFSATPRQRRMVRASMQRSTPQDRAEEPTTYEEESELQTRQMRSVEAVEQEPEDTPEEAPLPDN